MSSSPSFPSSAAGGARPELASVSRSGLPGQPVAAQDAPELGWTGSKRKRAFAFPDPYTIFPSIEFDPPTPPPSTPGALTTKRRRFAKLPGEATAALRLAAAAARRRHHHHHHHHHNHSHNHSNHRAAPTRENDEQLLNNFRQIGADKHRSRVRAPRTPEGAGEAGPRSPLSELPFWVPPPPLPKRGGGSSVKVEPAAPAPALPGPPGPPGPAPKRPRLILKVRPRGQPAGPAVSGRADGRPPVRLVLKKRAEERPPVRLILKKRAE